MACGRSVSLLVHSRHQKSTSFILYKRVIYTYTIVQHRNREGKKASLGWVGAREGSLRRRTAILTAINWIFKTCNLQSNDAILIINVLVLESVTGIKAKQKETIGAGGARNKLKVIIRERKKQKFGTLLMLWRVFLRAVKVEQGARGGSSWVGLYRLVASATLPPANQVRDKHKDD